jgi:hypothetical protein
MTHRFHRPLFIVLCAVAGAAGGYYWQPYVDPNPDLILIMITVFTVFAGFMVAIIAILGDPALLPQGSWRAAEVRRETIERRLIWHSYLFAAYLITIGLLFVGVVLAKVHLNAGSEWIRVWIERAYLFFGISSFLYSFALPWALMKIQQARVDAEIERRRAEGDAD